MSLTFGTQAQILFKAAYISWSGCPYSKTQLGWHWSFGNMSKDFHTTQKNSNIRAIICPKSIFRLTCFPGFVYWLLMFKTILNPLTLRHHKIPTPQLQYFLYNFNLCENCACISASSWFIHKEVMILLYIHNCCTFQFEASSVFVALSPSRRNKSWNGHKKSFVVHIVLKGLSWDPCLL